MSWTTQDLREVMTDRSLQTPAAPNRVSAAQRIARRQQTMRVAASAVLTVCLLVVAGLAGMAWLRGISTERQVPINPNPDLSDLHHARDKCLTTTICRTTARVNGLQITTSGPADVPFDLQARDNSFVVLVSLTNDSSLAWTGEVGVATCWRQTLGSERFLGPNDSWLQSASRDPRAQQPFVVHLSGGQRLDGVVRLQPITLAPGASETVAIQLVQGPMSRPGVTGWIPVLDPRGASPVYPDLSNYGLIG